MNLLPHPRSLRRQPESYQLAAAGVFQFGPALPRDTVLLPLAARLREAALAAGVRWELELGSANHPRLALRATRDPGTVEHPEGYTLDIDKRGIRILYREPAGLRAAAATLRQLLREYGRRLPSVSIRDHPDFPRRGIMLDVSRGRVPNYATLHQLADQMADLKLNELQLYVEHTFAYRDYSQVWGNWGPLTADDIIRLDAHCRRLGIDLVPNQNSFGHLRYWLEYPPLKPLAEVQSPYEGTGGTFLRYPTTLAPTHAGTLPFLHQLYDELLPNFTSARFNVGCDETWDLGRGHTKALCERHGKGRVYLDFLLKIHRAVSKRNRLMMFWGDIILHYPELIKELPRDLVALNWGYEANHPFQKEAGTFAKSGIPFYVCPGTSTWMTLIGRNDNAFANLEAAAKAGTKHGACGYLITDWGDGGHPQPLPVSYASYTAGAALAWCSRSYSEPSLERVLSRDFFADPTNHAAQAALTLGVAHREFNYYAPNITPFGTVITAPPPELRELVCRDGLKYYARIPAKNIRAALEAVEAQLQVLSQSRPQTTEGAEAQLELQLAARMAAQSCHIMLWQQALAADRRRRAATMAKRGIRELRQLDDQFNQYWPRRNKGTPVKCSAFLKWRIHDYRRAKLHFPPEKAK